MTNETKVAAEPVSTSKQVKDETNLMQENLSSGGVVAEELPRTAKKEENKQEKKLMETIEVKPEGEVDDQIDMSGTKLSAEKTVKYATHFG